MPELERLIADPATAGVLMILLQLLVLLVATLLALRYAHLTVRAALGRLFEREAQEGTAQDVSVVELQRRRDTLDGLVNRALRVIIIIIAFLMALQVLRLDIGPAIAGLGLVGLALSLGAQHLVRDYVAGSFVFIENQYSKGDVVRIANVTGVVEDVSLRRTTLRDTDGTVHYVPHGLIQTSSNLTRTWAGVDLDVPVPYDEDLQRMVAAIDESGRLLAQEPQWRLRVVETPRVLRVERLAEQGLVLKISGAVAAPHRFEAAGAMRRLIIETCEREGLTLGWRPVRPREAVDAPTPAETDSGRKS
jgi:moderate conductance mechanosensitive channel